MRYLLPDLKIYEKKEPFTMVPNSIIENPNLSWKAKGIMTALLKNKEGWHTNKKQLRKYATDGRNSLDEGLLELQKQGYLYIIPYQDKIKKRKCAYLWVIATNPDRKNYQKGLDLLDEYGYEPYLLESYDLYEGHHEEQKSQKTVVHIKNTTVKKPKSCTKPVHEINNGWCRNHAPNNTIYNNTNNNPNIFISKEIINNSLSKNIFVPSRDSEIDKFDTLNFIKPKMVRTKFGKALFDVPVQKKEKVSQDKYLALATKLSEIIQTKKNIKHTKSQIQAWSKEFARLERENGIQYQRQMAAMRWYEEHIGDPYTPVIESGTSFRNKFIRLEAAIIRSENSYTPKTKNNSGLAHFDPEYNDILMRKATEKVTVL